MRYGGGYVEGRSDWIVGRQRHREVIDKEKRQRKRVEEKEMTTMMVVVDRRKKVCASFNDPNK